MMNGQSFLFFGGSDWWLHAKRTESFLAMHLAEQGSKVLYVNTIGIGIPAFSAASTFKRLLKKCSSLVRWFRFAGPNLAVLSPIVIPLWSSAIIRTLNTVALRLQIAIACRLAQIDVPIIISAIPTSALMLPFLRYSAHIYFIKDYFSEYYEPMAWSDVKSHDLMLKQRSHAIVCSSIGMYDILVNEYSCVSWIPHGISTEYCSIDVSTQEPDWLSVIPRPRLLYWGQLENTLNSELIVTLARRKPEWSFLFIGPKLIHYGELEQLPNVHFIPAKKTSEVIAAGLHSDVLTIPWREMPWTRFSCPIKYREYLAIGKPVVSSPIVEVERAYPEAAYIASSAQEWIDAIETALRTGSPEKEAQRRSLIADCDPAATMTAFDDVISSVISRIQCAE